MDAGSQDRAAALRRFREEFGLGEIPESDLDLALTHRSYAFEHGESPDNERLEFLGDAILGAIVSEYLFEIRPGCREGELSKLKAWLVSRGMLGECAEEMGIGPLLLLGRGERRSGGERRRSVIGSALEALVAAIYLHSDYPRTRDFVRERILAPMLARHPIEVTQEDFKSLLQEWSQRVHGSLPVYERLGESGPDHAKAFSVAVSVAGKRLAEGAGSKVKRAENEAARRAMERIKSQESS